MLILWGVAAFVATVALVLVAAAAMAGAGPSVRLQELASDGGSSRTEKDGGGASRRRDLLPTLTEAMSGRHFTEKLYAEVAMSGLPIRPSEFVGIVAGLVVFFQVIAFLLRSSLAVNGILLAVGIGLPLMALKVLQGRRRTAFEVQIADALMMMAASLHSGFSFQRAMQMVAQEMRPPISQEFKHALNEVAVGRSLEEALRGVAKRVQSYDFDMAVTAISVQMRTGGDLSAILEILAATIRERMRIMGEIRALTAEGKISGVVLVALPIVVVLILTLTSPEYMSVLVKEKLGQWIIAGTLLLQLIGGLIIKKLLVLDV